MTGSARIPDGFEAFDTGSRFVDHVGRLYRHRDEPGRYGIRVEAHHANRQGDAHGGLLFTFADYIIPDVIRAQPDGAGTWVTVNLGADYFSTARLGQWLEGRVDVLRKGRSLCFAACDLMVGESRVGRVSGVFKRVRPPE